MLQLIGQNLKLYNKKMISEEKLWLLIEKCKLEAQTVGGLLKFTKIAGYSDLLSYL